MMPPKDGTAAIKAPSLSPIQPCYQKGNGMSIYFLMDLSKILIDTSRLSLADPDV
jgi:hypothetical protein